MSRNTVKKQEKKQKKERLYTLFVIVLALIVAGLCLLFFLRSCGRLPSRETGLFSASKVERVRLVNSAHDFSLVRSEGAWRNDADGTFPVDQDKVNVLLETLSVLPTERTLTGDAASELYGLTDPMATLTLTSAKGTEQILSIGASDGETGERYFTLTGKKGILTTSADLSALGTISEYDLIAVPQPPAISNKDVKGIRIVNNSLSTEVVLDRYPELRPDIDLSGTCTWFCTFPDGLERPANEDNIPYLLAAVESLRYEYCVGWNVSDAFLSACGFDDPEMELTVRYQAGEERILDLILSGSTQGGAHYFARERDGRNVFLIPASVGMFFESAAPDNMTSRNPGYVGMSSLSSFRMEADGKTVTGAIDRSNEPARYTVNGTETTQYDFTMLYATLFDLYGSSIVVTPQAERGRTVFSLTLELTQHETLDRLVYELSEHNDEQYAFSTNGRVWMLVDRSKLKDLEDAVERQLKKCIPG